MSPGITMESSVYGQISGAIAINAGSPSMSEDAQRLRFATAVFYDTGRLQDAVSGFLDLGLTENDLWFAGSDKIFQTGSLLHSLLISSQGKLKKLLERTTTIGKLSNKADFYATDGPVLQVLQKSKSPANAGNCLECFLKGDMGAILQDHAEKGAIILTVKTETPALQDQCVRLLLRTSLHKVYSQDCLLRFPLA